MEENKSDEENLNAEDNYKYKLKQMKYKYILGAVIVILLAVVLSVSITYYITVGDKYDKLYRATSNVITDETEIITATESVSNISAVLTAFAEVIDEMYIGDISKKEIIESTVKGFVEGIGDEYSEYMTKEEWDEYQSEQLGNYVGIGVYLSMDENDNVVIVGVIKDSPAESVGLKEEDIIVSIDGESAIGMDTEDVSQKVRGEENTEVKLGVYRNGEEKEFTITRKAIKVYHVEYEVLNNDIGYVYLQTFDEGCADEMKAVFDDLTSQGVKKVVLDLRYNTGGYVDEALDILDMLLDDGQISLITKSADGTEKIDKAKSAKDYNFKLVVLANEYSASASEILVGALKDNNRATIVGTTTYGKGVIQNVYPLSDGGILKLTTQEYFTPNNEKINKIGIEPDYEVELTDEDIENEFDSQLEKAKEILNQ